MRLHVDVNERKLNNAMEREREREREKEMNRKRRW